MSDANPFEPPLPTPLTSADQLQSRTVASALFSGIVAAIAVVTCLTTLQVAGVVLSVLIVPALLSWHFVFSYRHPRRKVRTFYLLPVTVGIACAGAGICIKLLEVMFISIEIPYLLELVLKVSTMFAWFSIGFEVGVARSLNQSRSFLDILIVAVLGGLGTTAFYICATLFEGWRKTASWSIEYMHSASVGYTVISLWILLIFAYSSLRADASIRLEY